MRNSDVMKIELVTGTDVDPPGHTAIAQNLGIFAEAVIDIRDIMAAKATTPVDDITLALARQVNESTDITSDEDRWAARDLAKRVLAAGRTGR